jgi:hypothetical protein
MPKCTKTENITVKHCLDKYYLNIKNPKDSAWLTAGRNILHMPGCIRLHGVESQPCRTWTYVENMRQMDRIRHKPRFASTETSPPVENHNRYPASFGDLAEARLRGHVKNTCHPPITVISADTKIPTSQANFCRLDGGDRGRFGQ